MTTELSRLIGANQGTRKSKDFYPTPTIATEYILSQVKFDGQVWEPSCGGGAISDILLKYGYDVKSTDLHDYGYGTPGVDFLKTLDPCDNIMTNPPFNIATKYAVHALNLARRKVVLLNKLSFLEGKERKQQLFSRKNLQEVHIFSYRLGFDNKDGKGGMLSFAWFVFDKEYQGDPIIKWI